MANLKEYVIEALDLPTQPGTRGYKRVADFMAWNPSTTIFSRFRSANLLNILSLQEEVCQLEQQLVNLIRSNGQDPDTQQRDWFLAQADGNGENKQRLKLLELREKLLEYSKLDHLLGHLFPVLGHQLTMFGHCTITANNSSSTTESIYV